MRGPPVNVSHLPCEQQRIVKEMLREESGAFAIDNGDIGCAKDFQLEINLRDNDPVQKTYNSIPKPLYGEVKSYLWLDKQVKVTLIIVSGLREKIRWQPETMY